MSRLKASGTTPREEGVCIAMTAIKRASRNLEAFVEDSDLPLTAAQQRGIKNTLAGIHDNLGKRIDKVMDWKPMKDR